MSLHAGVGCKSELKTDSTRSANIADEQLGEAESTDDSDQDDSEQPSPSDLKITVTASTVTANAGDEITLKATAAALAEGEVPSFAWQQLTGPTLAVVGADTSDLKFTAPNWSADAAVGFKVSVQTNKGGKVDAVSANVTIKGTNDIPSWTEVVSDFSWQVGLPLDGKKFAAIDPDEDQTVAYAFDLANMTCDDATWSPALAVDPKDGTMSGTPTAVAAGICSIRMSATSGTDKIYHDVTVTVLTPPHDISLTPASIVEYQPANSTIGTLVAADANTGDTHTFALVNGAGSDDNAAFVIDGQSLKIVASPEYTTQSQYSIRVEATDNSGLTFSKQLTVTVTNVNDPPTNLSLSQTSFNENIAAGATVATMTSTDIDPSDSHTYTLVAGTDADDNAAFSIQDNQLKIVASPDFETKASYKVRLRTTDAGSLNFERAFTLTVANVNEAPTAIDISATTLAGGQPPGTTVGTLSATDQDAGSTFTFELVAGTGSTDNALFAIDGTSLETAATLYHGTKSTYSVRIRVTDQTSLTFDRVVSISLNAPTWKFPADIDDFFHVADPSDASIQAVEVSMNNQGDYITVWNESFYAPDYSTQGRIHAATRSQGTWAANQVVEHITDPLFYGANLYQSVDINNNGDKIVAWGEEHIGKIKAKMSSGSSWGSAVELNANMTANSVVNTSVALADNGDAIVVWSQYIGSSIRAYKAEYRNGTWSIPASDADSLSFSGSDGLSPIVAVDGNGNAIVVWVSSDGTNGFLQKAEYRSGTWHLPASPADTFSGTQDHYAFDHRLTMNHRGDAVIVWGETYLSYRQIYKSEYVAGSGWTHPASAADNLSPDGSSAVEANAGIDNQGRIVVAWRQNHAASSKIFKADNLGGTWVLPASTANHISPASAGWPGAPFVTVNNGEAIIAWVHNYSVLLKSEYRGGTWTHPATDSSGFSVPNLDIWSAKVSSSQNGAAVITFVGSTPTHSYAMYRAEYH